MTTTETPALDLIQDAAMLADNLALRARFRQPNGRRQMTIYGVDYDGTDRSGRLTKVTDKVRVTDTGDGFTVLGLTGNNARTFVLEIAGDEDREKATNRLAAALGDLG